MPGVIEGYELFFFFFFSAGVDLRHVPGPEIRYACFGLVLVVALLPPPPGRQMTISTTSGSQPTCTFPAYSLVAVAELDFGFEFRSGEARL